MHEMQLDHDPDIAQIGITILIAPFDKMIASFSKMILIAPFDKIVLIATPFGTFIWIALIGTASFGLMTPLYAMLCFPSNSYSFILSSHIA